MTPLSVLQVVARPVHIVVDDLAAAGVDEMMTIAIEFHPQD